MNYDNSTCRKLVNYKHSSPFPPFFFNVLYFRLRRHGIGRFLRCAKPSLNQHHYLLYKSCLFSINIILLDILIEKKEKILYTQI